MSPMRPRRTGSIAQVGNLVPYAHPPAGGIKGFGLGRFLDGRLGRYLSGVPRLVGYPSEPCMVLGHPGWPISLNLGTRDGTARTPGGLVMMQRWRLPGAPPPRPGMPVKMMVALTTTSSARRLKHSWRGCRGQSWTSSTGPSAADSRTPGRRLQVAARRPRRLNCVPISTGRRSGSRIESSALVKGHRT